MKVVQFDDETRKRIFGGLNTRPSKDCGVILDNHNPKRKPVNIFPQKALEILEDKRLNDKQINNKIIELSDKVNDIIKNDEKSDEKFNTFIEMNNNTHKRVNDLQKQVDLLNYNADIIILKDKIKEQEKQIECLKECLEKNVRELEKKFDVKWDEDYMEVDFEQNN